MIMINANDVHDIWNPITHISYPILLLWHHDTICDWTDLWMILYVCYVLWWYMKWYGMIRYLSYLLPLILLVSQGCSVAKQDLLEWNISFSADNGTRRQNTTQNMKNPCWETTGNSNTWPSAQTILTHSRTCITDQQDRTGCPPPGASVVNTVVSSHLIRLGHMISRCNLGEDAIYLNIRNHTL